MISVCIATYNGVEFIEEQLQSILSQLDDCDEVIISDDGSTDGTLDKISSLHDSRIAIFNNQNHGYVHNFENALSHAKGDYIFLSDQDDKWFPNKVDRCLELLKTYMIVNHNSILTDKYGNESGVNFFSLHRSKKGFWHNIARNSYCGCCLAFRKDLLKYALPFPKAIASHDIWLGLIAEKKGKCCFLEEPLLYYRRHGNNASSTSEKSQLSLWSQIKYRCYMLLHAATR